jgi:hypothetical protein
METRPRRRRGVKFVDRGQKRLEACRVAAPAPTRYEVARRAYQLFEERGTESGHECAGTPTVKAAFMIDPEDLRDGGDTPQLPSLVGWFEANTTKCPDFS